MKLKIEISCDNAAFESDTAYELKRILEELAVSGRLDAMDESPLYDINGNRVGQWRITR